MFRFATLDMAKSLFPVEPLPDGARLVYAKNQPWAKGTKVRLRKEVSGLCPTGVVVQAKNNGYLVKHDEAPHGPFGWAESELEIVSSYQASWPEPEETKALDKMPWE